MHIRHSKNRNRKGPKGVIDTVGTHLGASSISVIAEVFDTVMRRVKKCHDRPYTP